MIPLACSGAPYAIPFGTPAACRRLPAASSAGRSAMGGQEQTAGDGEIPLFLVHLHGLAGIFIQRLFPDAAGDIALDKDM